MVQFVGMLPWRPNIDIIECLLQNGEVLDLHNDFSLETITFNCGPQRVVSLTLHDDRKRRVCLESTSASSIKYVSDDEMVNVEWDPEKITTMVGIDYSEGENGAGRFEIEAADGVCQFIARQVTLTILG